MEKIIAWIKKPGKNVVPIAVDNTLEAFQEIVGGYIECFAVSTDMTIVCNEDGKNIGLEPNVEILGEKFVGTIMFVGINENDPSEFDDLLVTEETMRRLFPKLWEEK